jgi:N-acylneuraminate cytidylyltransferase
MSTYALVPARYGSKGVPNKNFRPLAGGLSCVDRALLCAREAHVPASQIVLSTDAVYPDEPPDDRISFRYLARPPALALDMTPMVDVVRHAVDAYPGAPDDIWLILQPTQPFRTPAHVQAAIALLEAGARCVVSVTPATSPDKLWKQDVHAGAMYPWADTAVIERRQDARPAFRADGTVYAWRRRDDYWGWPFTPLLIPQDETCPLDTLQDWAEAERRLRDRIGHIAEPQRAG